MKSVREHFSDAGTQARSISAASLLGRDVITQRAKALKQLSGCPRNACLRQKFGQLVLASVVLRGQISTRHVPSRKLSTCHFHAAHNGKSGMAIIHSDLVQAIARRGLVALEALHKVGPVEHQKTRDTVSLVVAL